jgi:hypothetical protein
MTNTNISFVIRADVVSMMLPGEARPCMVRKDHPKFPEIVLALKKDDVAQVQALIDPIRAFCAQQNGRMSVDDGALIFDGEELHSVLRDKITEMIARNEDPSKFLRFMENLKQNPDQRAVNELYGFIENNALPITDDGYMLAYKTVRKDFYDHYSQTVLYEPGAIASMPREDVCSDPEQTCSEGLHVCTVGYLANGFFGGDSRSRLVLVKVHPRDVVCVPNDYRNSKLRCCQMTVLAEFRVRSGQELVDVDAAIKKNIKALQTNVKLNEAELREIIGVMAPQDGLTGYGKFGMPVGYLRKKLNVLDDGYLIKGVLPSENLHTCIDHAIYDIRDRFAELMGPGFELNELHLSKLEKLREKKITSLDPRFLILSDMTLYIDNDPSGADFASFEALKLARMRKDPDQLIIVNIQARLNLRKTEEIEFDD